MSVRTQRKGGEAPYGIADMIRDARKRAGLTQDGLADLADVSRPSVARIETGRDVSTATLSKVAAALGLTLKVER